MITLTFTLSGFALFFGQVLAHELRCLWLRTAAEVSADFGRVEDVFPAYRR